METTKLSSKGQIVLPKAVRDALEWPAGANLSVERRGDKIVLKRMPDFPARTVEEVAGCLKYDGPPISLADMEKAIDDEMQARWRRKGR